MSGPSQEFSVFLSYNSGDQGIVEKFAGGLRTHGWEVFLDRESLQAGYPWRQELERALRTCNGAVFFLGWQGLGPWQQQEVRLALDQQHRERSFRVIPVLLPGADPEPPPSFLAFNTWIDCRKGPDERHLERLIQELRRQSQPQAQRFEKSSSTSPGIVTPDLSPAQIKARIRALLDSAEERDLDPVTYLYALADLEPSLAPEIFDELLQELAASNEEAEPDTDEAQSLMWVFADSPEMQGVASEIDEIYGKLRVLLKERAGGPDLQAAAAPLQKRLRELQEKEADAMEQRYREGLQFDPEKAQRNLERAEKLLNKK